MSEACPLKVRQYLNLGLPVYLSHKDVFPGTFNYCKYGSGEASDIINYCFRAKKLYRKEVIPISQKYISRKQIMERTITQLRRGECSYQKNFLFSQIKLQETSCSKFLLN